MRCLFRMVVGGRVVRGAALSLAACVLGAGCTVVPKTTHERRLLGERLSAPRPQGAAAVWVIGRARGRSIQVEVADATACTRSVTRDVRHSRRTTRELRTWPDKLGDDDFPARGGGEALVAAFAVYLAVSAFSLPISAISAAVVKSKDWERTVEEQAPPQYGVCIRAARDREVRLRVADEPGVELRDLVARTDGGGCAVIDLPRAAPASGVARLQVAGAVPFEIRWREGQDLPFKSCPAPGGQRGPVWRAPDGQAQPAWPSGAGR